MTDQITYSPEEHAQHMEERKLLIEASRESSRTFDQAMLTFGSAIFGVSIAFIKDVAPIPVHSSLGWLVASWILFPVGLLCITLSFLFSQQACEAQITESEKKLWNPEHQASTNRWSVATTICNYVCIVFIFFGIMCWLSFAFINLGQKEA